MVYPIPRAFVDEEGARSDRSHKIDDVAGCFDIAMLCSELKSKEEKRFCSRAGSGRDVSRRSTAKAEIIGSI